MFEHLKLQFDDAIYRLRFYSKSLIHILSLSNPHKNVASMQKNLGDKSHRVNVALYLLLVSDVWHCVPVVYDRSATSRGWGGGGGGEGGYQLMSFKIAYQWPYTFLLLIHEIKYVSKSM